MDNESELEKVASALSEIAYYIKQLGKGDSSDARGAIEFHGMCVTDAAETIANALNNVADAIREAG